MFSFKVLVIEDEPIIAKSIEMTLLSHNFEQVSIAYNYNEGIEKLEKETPDLVILDINLQDRKDGIDIAEYINDNLQIPFIFLTSYSSDMVLDRAKKMIPMGYVVKPFSEKTLVSTIQIALYNYSQQFKPNKIDLKWINDRIAVGLSDREFDVLMEIYSGKNNQDIANALFVSNNTVKTHIKNLYLKMEVNSRWELLIKLRKIQ